MSYSLRLPQTQGLFLRGQPSTANVVDVISAGPDAARTYLGGHRDELRMPGYSRFIKGRVG
jgi:hypothetical protein